MKTKVNNTLRIIYRNILKRKIKTRVFQSTLDRNCFMIKFDRSSLKIGERAAVYLYPDTMDESACANNHVYWKEITTNKDILDIKRREVKQCRIKPTKTSMYPKVWTNIIPLMRFYKMILEEGYCVKKQIEHDIGFEFWMRRGDEEVVKVILRYQHG